MKKLFFTIVFAAVVGAATPAPTAAQTENGLRLPDEVRPFLETGTAAIAFKKADLNGDGTLDYIVVQDKKSGDEESADDDTTDRPTLIVTRDRAGVLSLAARNDLVVTCRSCAAPFSNPFEGIVVGKSGFTIEVTTGSKAHLTYKYTFAYSQRDKTWLLTRVVETDYNIYTDRSTTEIFTTPRSFGKITFADFGTSDFLVKGRRQKTASVKTRTVTIYVNGAFDADNGVYTIVPVRRRIVDYRPLDAALKLLLEGPTEDEMNRGLSHLVLDLKFHSARVRNKTAQINLRLEREENLEESWEGAGFRYDKFVEAAGLTAAQFPGVEKVSICINGIENYTDFGRTKDKKCSFPMFPGVKLPKPPR